MVFFNNVRSFIQCITIELLRFNQVIDRKIFTPDIFIDNYILKCVKYFKITLKYTF